MASNDDDGVGDCSKLSLAAGTHTLAVRHYSSTAAGGDYLLILKP